MKKLIKLSLMSLLLLTTFSFGFSSCTNPAPPPQSEHSLYRDDQTGDTLAVVSYVDDTKVNHGFIMTYALFKYFYQSGGYTACYKYASVNSLRTNLISSMDQTAKRQIYSVLNTNNRKYTKLNISTNNHYEGGIPSIP